MDKKPWEVERGSEEWQFVILTAYLIHKYIEGEAVVDYKGFGEFMNQNRSLERIDEGDKSIYRVK